MEGISHEAISIAGHLKLNKLIVFFDDNGISIDGPLSPGRNRRPGGPLRRRRLERHRASTGTTRTRSPRAIEAAQKSDRPTMIACKTTIGFGAPTKAGTQKAHSDAPLARRRSPAPASSSPGIRRPSRFPPTSATPGASPACAPSQARKDWEKRLAAADSNRRGEFERRMRGDLPPGFDEAITRLQEDARRRGSPRSPPARPPRWRSR